jgi:protein tyrosine/serine phosphatase
LRNLRDRILPSRRRRRIAALVLGAALALPAGLGLWLAGLQLTGNIHAVEPGVLYRSAQLGESALIDVIDDYHIKSVINLRGADQQAFWYRRELAVSRAHGVAHYDFPLSANSLVDPATMARIDALLRSAPKPVLIHCQSGADRTGLVAALYQYAIAARPPAEAAAQLSLRYGHVPYLWSRTGAMDESFAIFVRENSPKPGA